RACPCSRCGARGTSSCSSGRWPPATRACRTRCSSSRTPRCSSVTRRTRPSRSWPPSGRARRPGSERRRTARRRRGPWRPYSFPVDFSFALTPDLAAVFATLFVLELVLGVDNVIFISILASKLPVELQAKARNLGLTLAMVMRVLLGFLAGWIITLKADVVTWFGMGFSVKDFILIAGGGFLVYKAVMEIHHKLEGEEEHADASTGGSGARVATVTFRNVLLQILALDLVFSLDSVITAVGMT